MKRSFDGGLERVSFGTALLDFFSDRSASTHAAFFLGCVEAGMKILDCGCGPGSITLDLARLVFPGEAIGIDIERAHVERAQELQRERNVRNAKFQVADLHHLPFDDGTFDAVFTHGVVEYFGDPVSAFSEVRRVLKSGGVFGARHGDWGGFLLATRNRYTKKAFSLFVQLMKRNGGKPQFGRNQGSYLRQAGFSRITTSASYDCWTSNPETALKVGRLMKGYFTSKDFVIPALKHGLVDRKTLPKIQSAFDDWGKDQDVFAAEAWGESVAWKA